MIVCQSQMQRHIALRPVWRLRGVGRVWVRGKVIGVLDNREEGPDHGELARTTLLQVYRYEMMS